MGHTREDISLSRVTARFFARLLFARIGSVNTAPAFCFSLTLTQFPIELRLSQSPHSLSSNENQRSVACPHGSAINQQIVSSFFMFDIIFYFKPRVKIFKLRMWRKKIRSIKILRDYFTRILLNNFTSRDCEHFFLRDPNSPVWRAGAS
jgi:hypothetical protein